jgi:hypothetical protein
LGDTGIENLDLWAQLSQVPNVAGHVDVLATDGASSASLRALLNFREAGIGLLGTPLGLLGLKGQVSETNTLTCAVVGDSMSVQASVFGLYNGGPWFLAAWHSTFRRESQ